MSSLGASLRSILTTDLFALKPAGFTPTASLAVMPSPVAARSDIPPTGTPGETQLISDASRVVLAGGDEARLSALYADDSLRMHILGPSYTRLPFSLRLIQSGIWSLLTHDMKMEFLKLYEMARVDESLAQLVQPDHQRYIAERKAYNMLFSEGMSVLQNLAIFRSEHVMRQGDVVLNGGIERLSGILRSMCDAPPPFSFTYVDEPGMPADSLMMVASAEYGAELFLGWKGNMTEQPGRRILNAITEGAIAARSHINAVPAVVNSVHHVPAMFPYSMTGGVTAFMAGPPSATFAIDDWMRTPSKVLWERVRQQVRSSAMQKYLNQGWEYERAKDEAARTAEAAIERIFAEHVIPWKSMSTPMSYNDSREQRVMSEREYNHFGKLPGHFFTSDQFSAHFMAFQNPATSTFSMMAQGMPTTWTILNGAVTLRSPSGKEMELRSGESCLIPATSLGNYAVDISSEPTGILSLSGAPSRSFSTDHLEGGMAFLKGFGEG